MIQSIQLRGGTAAAMCEANPLLKSREIAVETDTGKIKVGNGADYWNDLPYSGSGNSSAIFQLKRATKNTWLETNPILAEGEPALELHTFNLKIGDGITHWINLPYVIYTGLDDSPLKILTDFIPDAVYNNFFSFQFTAIGAENTVWSCVTLGGINEPDDKLDDNPIAFTTDVLDVSNDFSNFNIPLVLPNGITFDASNASLSGTPKERGTFLLKISASDGEASVYRNFLFRIL